MESISSTRIVARETDSASPSMSPAIIDLLIVILVLIFVSLLLVGALFFIRKIRTRRSIARQQLPTYNEKVLIPSKNKRLTISTSRASSIYVYDEKSSMMSNTSSPTLSINSVPEIRITFPDEEDKHGRRTSGRVVVVRVGETGVGLEPLRDEEQLPAYEKDSRDRFDSIDMDRIGGLKEKSEWS